MRNLHHLGLMSGFAVAVAATLTPSTLSAQAYPSKPIRIVVPLSAGSQTDILARIIGQRMTESWQQPVVVENHPGAGGQVGGRVVVNAAPDGYTLMLHSDGHAVSAALYHTRLPYDTLRDFSRVSLVASSPSVLIVAPSLGVKSVPELVALAKATPAGLTFGSAGIGGGTHFTGEMFRLAAGINATHVPFRGMPEAITETMMGRVSFVFSSLSPAWPYIKDGKVLAIAVGSAQRSPVLPNVPAVAESGFPGFGYELWFGLLAPARTPPQVVQQVSAEIARIMALPDVKDRLLSQGLVPRGSTPEAFDSFLRAEIDKLSQVIKLAGIKAE